MTTSFASLPTSKGTHFPLGATPREDGWVNFSVNSQFASSIILCIFADPGKPQKETHRVPLENRTGDTWFTAVSGIPERATYGYRAEGVWDPKAGLFFNPDKLLLDPYAKHIDGPSAFHSSLVSKKKDGEMDPVDSGPYAPRAFVPRHDPYDWEGDAPLRTPMSDTVISELHVKGFSKLNPNVPEEIRGTYSGLAHEASTDYFRNLGVTAVQLIPVHQHLDDGFLLDRNLVNYWGYNTLGSFAPEARYASTDDPVSEFRDMVKAMHRAGIEVILDVVYNHTCEGGVDGPTCLLRGFDNAVYYHTHPIEQGVYHDYTGCGNSVNVAHPTALKLVMDSMRYWIEEMHVDGFRFDLAVELGRDGDTFARRAAFFQAVSQDPVVGRTKLIAEPWDLGPGGYQIGNFPTKWNELNGKFRDDVRRFWRGDPGVSGDFAGRITGSEELFAHNRRTPLASVNMITSHDGFTLHDLVSYNQKHNLANGEKNADGDSHNISDNHGAEGPTKDRKILATRKRQIRNYLATMICSQGVPFLLSGDERLRTQGGNNNGYCQDNEITWISWDDSEEAAELREFVKRMLQFRRDNPVLRRSEFFTGKRISGAEYPDVCWLRPDGGVKDMIDWGVEKAGAFAMLIHGTDDQKSLLFFFNARKKKVEFHFPSNENDRWSLVTDTADPSSKGEIGADGESLLLTERSMQIWEEA